VAQKISDEIPLALSNLKKAVMNISTASSSSNQPEEEQQQPQQQTTTAITSNSVIKQIKEIVNNINDILDKAASVRINKIDLTNPTVHALVLADITEKAYNDYSHAYGIKPFNFSGPPSSYSSYMMMNNSGTGMGMGTMAMGGSGNASTTTTNNSTKSQYEAKIVVVCDLLDMFVRDPQIGADEPTYLINEIANSITKSRALEDVLVIVSFSYVPDLFHRHNKPYRSYGRTILQRSNNCIEITDSKKNKVIDVKISSSSNKNKRIKNTTNDFHNGKSVSINKRDLLTVSSPAK
jgi:hypothetical protein